MNDTEDDRARRSGGTPTSRSRRHTDRPGSMVAITLAIGIVLLLSSNLLIADESPSIGDDEADLSASRPAPADAGGAMIPRDALVDMTRAQSGIICSSEAFLGCMGFDGTTCLSLSESAIDRCLMPLPAEIDPTTLDSATLEDCPRVVYEEAGYDDATADACFLEAVEGN